MNKVLHNLPPDPYRKFFGRKKDIQNIYEAIVLGQTYIASIDGAGGIGKSALAHYFCQEMIINEHLYYDETEKKVKERNLAYYGEQKVSHKKLFDYVVWITAKDSVFNSFAKENQKIEIENKFLGIETLFDALLEVTGFSTDCKTFEEKKLFFEEIVTSESVLFVLDNLENVNDSAFFSYIKEGFNLFAKTNTKDLKILTTSRKRKKIIDNPIDIEGLSEYEALEMLNYLAGHNPNKVVNDILNSDAGNNLRLVKKLGMIPLMIEFAVGRMSNGKTRGEIDAELKGYRSLDNIGDKNERKKIIAEIIDFQFSSMYEDLSEKEKNVFKTIVILLKNRYKNEELPSFESLMFITKLEKQELKEIIDVLLDNKLIKEEENEHYGTYPMANNLAMQIYSDMEEMEKVVMTQANEIKTIVDKAGRYLNSAQIEINRRDYKAAELILASGIELFPYDHRLYHAMADLDLRLGRKSRADENYKEASERDPSNSIIWYDWIAMDFNAKQFPTAIKRAREAIKKTNWDITIVNLLMDIFFAEGKEAEWRKLVIDVQKIYAFKDRKQGNGNLELIALLRHWKTLEYKLYKSDKHNEYFQAAETLIVAIDDPCIKLELLNEELQAAEKEGNMRKIYKINEKIKRHKSQIFSTPLNKRRRDLREYYAKTDFEKAKAEANLILRWISHPDLNEEQHGWIMDAFFILFEILEKETKFEEIIACYRQNEAFCRYEARLTEFCVNAQNKIEEREKENVIKEIGNKIHRSEVNLRQIILFNFDSNETKFLTYIRTMPQVGGRSIKHMIDEWVANRNKGLIKKLPLINYSSLFEAKTIYGACLKDIYNKIKIKNPTLDKSALEKLEKDLERVKQIVDLYILEARNLFSHVQLLEKSVNEINEISVDSDRILRFTSDVKRLAL